MNEKNKKKMQIANHDCNDHREISLDHRVIGRGSPML